MDVYPKTLDDFREQTISGAIVSIITTLFVFWLFFTELTLFLRAEMDPQLFVDTERSEKIRVIYILLYINIDILY